MNLTYQVIEMYGENEPWWFFKDWEEDIVTKQEFTSFSEAIHYLEKKIATLTVKYEEKRCKPDYMVAFWNEDEIKFCEECDDDIQLYHGILMLKDGKKIMVNGKEQHEKISIGGEAKRCQRFS